MKREEVLRYLCYYDLRNPDGVIAFLNKEEIKQNGYGNYSKKNCFCEDCFHGRTKLAEELLKYVTE